MLEEPVLFISQQSHAYCKDTNSNAFNVTPSQDHYNVILMKSIEEVFHGISRYFLFSFTFRDLLARNISECHLDPLISKKKGINCCDIDPWAGRVILKSTIFPKEVGVGVPQFLRHTAYLSIYNMILVLAMTNQISIQQHGQQKTYIYPP